MSKKPAALGRGLDALFAGNREISTLRNLPLDLIHPGTQQARKHFDEAALAELAESIRAEGVLQPILVRADGGGGYELLAGERRWRAAQLAELREIPALIREASEQQALVIGIIENIQRQDLDPLEEAAALQRLLDEFRLSHDALAQALGRSRAAITNQLRLLRLDPSLAPQLRSGALTAGHARTLLSLPPAAQRQAAAEIIAKGMSVRQAEFLAKNVQEREKRAPEDVDPNLAALLVQLEQTFGLQVRISLRREGGELRIRWRNAAEAAALWQRLGVTEDSVPLS
ncbi:ParB/RepB/Spo0J family partition protein [Acidithiobacillus sp. AMEEHan]|uniref:ParB/RepB/Spo0J family partition protein n=1 Tax=Acidithiobacillus sp. AMEEHan TaxID=2994951 RepID=UPI0027E3D181|nr:ParB/RepB/Spo0J family partition protein [Acidithiobacillus sp. AMEEHan]